MRKSVTLRWIEQAEAAQVLAGARFERAPARVWGRRTAAALALWRERLAEWLAPQPALGCQLQPVRVRRSPSRRPYDDSRSRW